MARLRRGLGGQAFRGGGEFAILHHFGADETFRDVTVDRVRGFDGSRALPDVPGADFVFAGGEEGNVAERLVELPGQDVQGRLGDAEGGEKFGAFVRVFDLRDFGFGFGGEFADFGAGAGDFRFRGFKKFRVRFAAVERDDKPFHGEKLE